jgi:diamine N-acetyltransferase
MTTELRIRNASQDDLALLRDMGRQAFADTFMPYNTAENMKLYLDKNYATEKIADELKDPDSEFLLVWDDSHCAGYAKLKKSDNPHSIQGKAIEIERLYAVQHYIGKQVGKKLMEACIERATRAGYHTIWLGVWEKNIRAIKFYEKNGFVKFDEHVFMLGNDAQNDWLMKKTLV